MVQSQAFLMAVMLLIASSSESASASKRSPSYRVKVGRRTRGLQYQYESIDTSGLGAAHHSSTASHSKAKGGGGLKEGNDEVDGGDGGTVDYTDPGGYYKSDGASTPEAGESSPISEPITSVDEELNTPTVSPASMDSGAGISGGTSPSKGKDPKEPTVAPAMQVIEEGSTIMPVTISLPEGFTLPPAMAPLPEDEGGNMSKGGVVNNGGNDGSSDHSGSQTAPEGSSGNNVEQEDSSLPGKGSEDTPLSRPDNIEDDEQGFDGDMDQRPGSPEEEGDSDNMLDTDGSTAPGDGDEDDDDSDEQENSNDAAEVDNHKESDIEDGGATPGPAGGDKTPAIGVGDQHPPEDPSSGWYGETIPDTNPSGPTNSAVMCPGVRVASEEVVWWTYSVTLDNVLYTAEDADASISILEPELQSSIVNLLDCNRPSSGRHLQTEFGIVGMDVIPNDVAQDEERCTSSTGALPCFVYIGSITLFLEESADPDIATFETRKAIQSLMSETNVLSIPMVESAEYLAPDLSNPSAVESGGAPSNSLQSQQDEISPAIPVLASLGGLFVVIAIFAAYRLQKDNHLEDGRSTIGPSTVAGAPSRVTDHPSPKILPSSPHGHTLPGRMYRMGSSPFGMNTILEDSDGVSRSRDDSDITVSDCGYTTDEISRADHSYMNILHNDSTILLGARRGDAESIHEGDLGDDLSLFDIPEPPSSASRESVVSPASAAPQEEV